VNSDELKAEANKDPTESPYRVSVLYGDHGKRKTTTACSMVHRKGLLLSSDASWKVLLNDRHKELYSKLKIITLEGFSQLNYIDFEDYDTIIWDTVSQSVDVFIDLLYDQGKWASKNGGSGGYREQIITTNPELKGLEILSPMDYRVTRDAIRPAMNKLFKETEAHIIFTSQMTEPLPGLSKDQRNRPSIPAATFKIIGTRADIIGQIKPHNRKFVIDCSEDSLTVLGKSRIEGLQGQIDLDTFVKTYKEIVFK
jgi:hypothetical protein